MKLNFQLITLCSAIALLVILLLAGQLNGQSVDKNKIDRLGLEISGLQGFNNFGSINEFDSPTAMVSFFYRHFITDNVSGIGQIGIGQLTDRNGKRFMAPVDFRMRYDINNTKNGFLNRLHFFGGIGFTFFNPIEVRREENLPLSDENVSRSKLFGFQSGISLITPAGIGIKLTENRDSEISFNLTYNYNVIDLVESADQKFPGSYVGASIRFGFNKGKNKSVGIDPIKNRQLIPTPQPYSDEIYTYSEDESRDRKSPTAASEKVETLPHEPITDPESVFSDDSIGDIPRKMLDPCQKRLFLGTYSSFTEALDIAEKAQEYSKISFDVVVDRQQDLLKVLSSPLTRQQLLNYIQVNTEILEKPVKVLRFCDTLPEKLKYRVQIGAFLNPHNASRYAKSSSHSLDQVAVIKKYKDDPYYRVQLSAKDDWRSAFKEKDSVQEYLAFRDAYVSTDPRILDLDGSNGYVLQFGVLFSRVAAKRLANMISQKFGLHTQLTYSDIENSYRVVSKRYHDWQVIHQLRDMIRLDHNTPDPSILIINMQGKDHKL